MKYKVQIIIVMTSLLLGQTEQQIRQAKQVIQRHGMSEKQVRDAAKAQGFTEKQIDNVLQKEKVKRSQKSKSTPLSSKRSGLPELGKSNEIPKKEPKQDIINEELQNKDEESIEAVIDSNPKDELLEETTQDKLTYFGYDIFERDPALFQATSVGAVDPDYLIGPGDEIIVMLWGETQFRQVLEVDREGFVFIPEIGQAFVNGLNLNLLESKLFRVFSQSYASLNPQVGTPTTFLDVSLGNLRPLRIQVLGEVSQPGAYTVSPSATLFSSLYYFNGPTTLGSLREIQLIRGGKKIESIDFYDYLLSGEKPKDQKLQLDDVIFIPRRSKTVSIQGEINRSGIYELKQKESLTDLIAMAGDLKISAYLDRAQIDRIVPFEDRKELGMDRMYIDVDLKGIFESKDDFLMQDGDHIKIFSVMELRQNVVDLRGAVSRPGRYDLGESLTLSELIKKADGLSGDAFLDRVDIVRTKPDLTEELIKLDLGKAINGDSLNNIRLQGFDRIQVFGMAEMASKSYVSIKGFVKQPGLWPLQINMTLYDLIFKAGGFLDEKHKKLAYLKRAEIVRIKDNEKKIIPFNLGEVLKQEGLAKTLLYPDDQVRIYSSMEIEGEESYVTVSGHVKRPGRYELYEDNMRIYDLLFKAGGLDDPIFFSQAFLPRADLIRFNEDRISKSIIPFNLKNVLSNKNNKQNVILHPGDEVKVYSEAVFNSVRPVAIKGIVRQPGEYEYKTDMKLKDLILEAGGLNENVYRYRVEIARLDPLNNNLDQYASVITLNINEKLDSLISSDDNSSNEKKSVTSNDFQLEPFDLVTLRPDPYFRLHKQVTIGGEILYPGDYSILKSDEKITDIIDRAGGLRHNAYPDASKYIRNGVKIDVSFNKILKNPRSNLNFEVQDGDSIMIVPHPNIVMIAGEVNTSGVRKFVPGKRLRYYLNLSGGLNPNADKNNIWVEYPNGDSKKYKSLFRRGPKVIDGSVIVVGKKPEEEPFDWTEYFKEVTAILANLAQTYVLILAVR